MRDHIMLQAVTGVRSGEIAIRHRGSVYRPNDNDPARQMPQSRALTSIEANLPALTNVTANGTAFSSIARRMDRKERRTITAI